MNLEKFIQDFQDILNLAIDIVKLLPVCDDSVFVCMFFKQFFILTVS